MEYDWEPDRHALSLPRSSRQRGTRIRQLIDIQIPVERTFLVGAPRKGSEDAVHVDDHLDELARLVDTAGGEVVGRLHQRVDAPTPKLFLGQGKVDELRGRVGETGTSLVVFDEALSPVQGANLEKALGVRIMDRTEIILDIFATRARSHEAKLQVELGQLEYLLPRLTRMWTHLSRIRGGIGLRGPGETQLETDRRAIRRKIAVLKRRLQDVAAHRANQRQGRRDVPHAALVGYTNAGKSSLLRALTGDAVFVEDRLFATLDTLTREVDVGEHTRCRVTDTVGFIRKLPHHLIASFRATLEEARQADVLVHVIDAVHPAWREQLAVVDGVLEEMGLTSDGAPGDRAAEPTSPRVLHVFNKADLLPDATAFLTSVRERYPDAVLTSAAAPGGAEPGDTPRAAAAGDGVAGLRAALQRVAQALRPVVHVRVPLGDGRLLAELHRESQVLGQQQTVGVVVVTARVEPRLLGRLRQGGIDVEVGEGS
jgi:GTP-binding protein HflX